MADEKHYLIAKVIALKGEQLFWEAFEVDLGDKEPEEVTQILNDSLNDLVKDVPKGCQIELKIVKDPNTEESLDATI